MKSKEFMQESTEELANGVGDALTHTQVGTTGQDPYQQYRFGLMMAAAKAAQNGDIPTPETPLFGPEMVLVSRSKEEEEIIRLAKKLSGGNHMKQIASHKSTEAPDTYKQSPIQPYNKKLGRR